MKLPLLVIVLSCSGGDRNPPFIEDILPGFNRSRKISAKSMHPRQSLLDLPSSGRRFINISSGTKSLRSTCSLTLDHCRMKCLHAEYIMEAKPKPISLEPSVAMTRKYIYLLSITNVVFCFTLHEYIHSFIKAF